MKKILVWVLIFLCSVSHAQVTVDVLGGNRQAHFLSYWHKDIDSAGKFNFFSLSRFAIDYKDKAYNNFGIEGQFSYMVNDWFGFAAGGGYEGDEFVPTIGLNLGYQSKKGDFYIEGYPTILFAETKAFSIFGFCGYTPQFNSRWGLFAQVIFSTSLDLEKTQQNPKRQILGLFTAHQQSTQMIRVGPNFRKKYQFGLGADLSQFYGSSGGFGNVGIFVRAEL